MRETIEYVGLFIGLMLATFLDIFRSPKDDTTN